VSRRYSTKDGESREETTFVDVDAFGRQAEVITKYLRKGSPIFMEGRLRFDQWETNDGQKRSKLGVVLENFQFVGGNRDENGGSGSSGGYENSSPPARSSNPTRHPAAKTSPVPMTHWTKTSRSKPTFSLSIRESATRSHTHLNKG